MVGALGGEGVGCLVMSGTWVVTFVSLSLSGSEQAAVQQLSVGQVMDNLLPLGFIERYVRVDRGC